MARLNDDAQWIVLMGFLVSFGLFFLGMLLNQSVVVGQTTAEGVLDFPKNDIRDVKDVVINSSYYKCSSAGNFPVIQTDITTLALSRKNAIVDYSVTCPNSSYPYTTIEIHYNNGVTEYHETWTSK
jgi:hypothetical protein